ncbi:hypothetical protein [Limosilactobacillus reuteri]|uniref:hypothetical protein n=1 Tax=Limosilactobacillus reuteri TaxID=1598 RepID=UPI002F263927
MEVQDAYLSWINTLNSPHTIRSYQRRVKRLSLAIWGKDPWKLTYNDLKSVTRADIKQRFYNPVRKQGISQDSIKSYFPPFKQFVEKINQLGISPERVNAEKFRFTGQVLSGKRQLENRLAAIEKEIEDIKAILATYDYKEINEKPTYKGD